MTISWKATRITHQINLDRILVSDLYFHHEEHEGHEEEKIRALSFVSFVGEKQFIKYYL